MSTRERAIREPSREELAEAARTLATLVSRIGEELVEAIERCEHCNGTAACDACFAALQSTLRYRKFARQIEARLAAVRKPHARSASSPAAH